MTQTFGDAEKYTSLLINPIQIIPQQPPVGHCDGSTYQQTLGHSKSLNTTHTASTFDNAKV